MGGFKKNENKMGVTYTVAQLQKLKRVEVDGLFVHIDKVTPKGKVSKLPNLLERPDNKVIGNKKVKNATKVVIDGVKFDSQLEAYMYKLLKGSIVNFIFQREYELQPKFKFNGEAIKAIKMIVDFWLPDYNMIVDTKGWATDISKLKYKMLKYKYSDIGLPMKIEMPSTEKECDLLLNRLIYDKAKITSKS